MYWVIVGIIIVFLLLIMPVSEEKQDRGKTKAGTIVSTSLVLLILGALGTVIGMLVGP